MQKPQPIKTKITEMFSIDYPIIGAPMFLVSNEGMVCAASNAGGLGTFPALNYRPIANYSKAIQDIKKQTDKAFGINIIVQKSNKFQHEQIDIAIAEEVPLIITSLGSPREVLKKVKGTKTRVFCDVVGLEHAKKVADLGADGLIAVGSGAGGHAGDTSPFALIPYLKNNIDLPLVAAGSIGSGEGMLAALALGADGIYMGTRIIASKEAQVKPAYKDAIVKAAPEDIISTDRVDGFPGNFINTPLLEKLIKPNLVENVISQSERVKRMISLMRAGRALFGNNKKASYSNVFSAGHGVGLIDSVESIEHIFWSTMAEYRQLQSELPK